MRLTAALLLGVVGCMLTGVRLAHADTPANCSYASFLGHWTVMASEAQAPGTNCTGVATPNAIPGLTLAYPNIARDDAGNVGNWTLIYNQGVEVWIAGRIHFAYSAYNSTGASFCDQTQVGWSHDMGGNEWSCFSAQRDRASETTLSVYTNGACTESPVNPPAQDVFEFEPDACLATPSQWAAQYPAFTISLDLANNGYVVTFWSDAQCTQSAEVVSGNGAMCAEAPTGPTFSVTTPITQPYTVQLYPNTGCQGPPMNTFGLPIGMCDVSYSTPSLFGGASSGWTLSDQSFTATIFSDSACQTPATSVSGKLEQCLGGTMVVETPLPMFQEDAPAITGKLERIQPEPEAQAATDLFPVSKHTKILLTEDSLGVASTPVASSARRVYRSNPDFLKQVNSAQSLFTVRAYAEFEGVPLEHLERKRGGKHDLREVARMHGATEKKPSHKCTNKKNNHSSKFEIPAAFDWRNVSGVDYVSPVRDQGQCGSCYAFSSAGMMEARIRLASQNQKQPILSTQDVVSCSFYSQGCEGGFPYLIAGKYGRDIGLLEEACYPYAGVDSACTPNPQPGCNPERWMSNGPCDNDVVPRLGECEELWF
jgi:hypothetical protein